LKVAEKNPQQQHTSLKHGSLQMILTMCLCLEFKAEL